MNLFERLHPVYEDNLSKANLQYPDLIENLVEDLEQVELVTELKYGTIMDLRTICGWQNSPFDYFIE
jgi:hypothetical protein